MHFVGWAISLLSNPKSSPGAQQPPTPGREPPRPGPNPPPRRTNPSEPSQSGAGIVDPPEATPACHHVPRYVRTPCRKHAGREQHLEIPLAGAPFVGRRHAPVELLASWIHSCEDRPRTIEVTGEEQEGIPGRAQVGLLAYKWLVLSFSATKGLCWSLCPVVLRACTVFTSTLITTLALFHHGCIGTVAAAGVRRH